MAAPTRMLVCALILLTARFNGFMSSSGPNEVPFIPVANAKERLAVCLDGSPARYYKSSGFGDGAINWIVYLQGGGWCPDKTACKSKRTTSLGSSLYDRTNNLTGILSKRQDINPDFYNWNKIYVKYCDQSSFLGDTEIVDRGLNLQFRGSRIFDAVIQDLLAKGMVNADNAILAGRSAGGLATILHCDGFRVALPKAGRVKCISDAGFFVRVKGLPYSECREKLFASTIMFHCLFPEYLVVNVQTPLFLLNSAFDLIQLQDMLVPPESSEWPRWQKCLGHLQNCTIHDNQVIKDFGKTFLKAIGKIPYNQSRGIYIHSCYRHTVTMYPDDVLWNPNSKHRWNNLTISHAVSNWYFDRGSVNVIETYKFPNATCSLSRYISTKSEGLRAEPRIHQILFFLQIVLIYFSF